MGSNPSYNQNCGDTCPVERLSWEETQLYVRKLNAISGQQFRLPSEAEWEYAARSGGTGDWCFGDDESQLGIYAWYSGNSSSTTHPVAGKRANAFGLHDMHGNVWEWVEDYYHDSYHGAPQDGESWLIGGEQRYRVQRGGSRLSDPEYVRSTARVRATFDLRNYSSDDNGFRLARTLSNP